MTTLAWISAISGTVACVSIIVVIWVDVWLVSNGFTSISRWLWTFGCEHPIVPIVTAAAGGVGVGIAIGHFWFPQWISK